MVGDIGKWLWTGKYRASYGLENEGWMRLGIGLVVWKWDPCQFQLKNCKPVTSEAVTLHSYPHGHILPSTLPAPPN
jgi:hypothetical protein